MKMSNKVYDILKLIIFLIAPVVALITGLGELYNFDTTIIVGTITLIGTFLSAITGYSNYNYNKFEEFKEDRLPTVSEEELKEETEYEQD